MTVEGVFGVAVSITVAFCDNFAGGGAVFVGTCAGTGATVGSVVAVAGFCTGGAGVAVWITFAFCAGRGGGDGAGFGGTITVAGAVLGRVAVAAGFWTGGGGVGDCLRAFGLTAFFCPALGCGVGAFGVVTGAGDGFGGVTAGGIVCACETGTCAGFMPEGATVGFGAVAGAGDGFGGAVVGGAACVCATGTCVGFTPTGVIAGFDAVIGAGDSLGAAGIDAVGCACETGTGAGFRLPGITAGVCNGAATVVGAGLGATAAEAGGWVGIAVDPAYFDTSGAAVPGVLSRS